MNIIYYTNDFFNFYYCLKFFREENFEDFYREKDLNNIPHVKYAESIHRWYACKLKVWEKL